MRIYNIEPKDILRHDGTLLGTASKVLLRVLPSESDDNDIAPGYFEYQNDEGAIHREARGNIDINVTDWSEDRNSVYAYFLGVLDLNVIEG